MGRGITSKMKESVNINVPCDYNWIQATCGNDENTSKIEAFLKKAKHIKLWEYVETYNIVSKILFARIGSNRKQSYNITIDM